MFKRETHLTHLSPWSILKKHVQEERDAPVLASTPRHVVYTPPPRAPDDLTPWVEGNDTHTTIKHDRRALREEHTSALLSQARSSTTADQTPDRSCRASFFPFTSPHSLQPSPSAHPHTIEHWAAAHRTWHIQRNVRRPLARDTSSSRCPLRQQELCTFARQFPAEPPTHRPNGCFRGVRDAWATGHVVTFTLRGQVEG